MPPGTTEDKEMFVSITLLWKREIVLTLPLIL